MGETGNGRGELLRFAGFELDQRRAELRRPDGSAIRLRPKAFAMLALFATNAGRVVSKQELMDALWPSIHVGEDSLFQCVRELRTALGDDQKQLLKAVSGRGYLFEVTVTGEPVTPAATTQIPAPHIPVPAAPASETATGGEPAAAPPSRWQRVPAIAVGAFALCAGLAVAAWTVAPDFLFPRNLAPAVAMTPIAGSSDADVARMAASVTESLTDGLAKIANIRVVAPARAADAPQSAAAPAAQADFTVSGELQKNAGAWTVQTRLTRTATGEVLWSSSASVSTADTDAAMQQSRLTGGIGYPLALRLNALLHTGLPSNDAKVVVEQSTALIRENTRERFAAAQTMLENALTKSPDDVDLEVTLAAHLLRGIQLVWYSPFDSESAERRAQALLERAVTTRPDYLPVLETRCRLLTATNHFVESLVACARTLALNPWDGMALFQLGLSELQLARFDDALATFKQADRYDTPGVSRWTWLLGAGLTYVTMGRDAEAVPWLQRSLAITPGTGRTHLVLAAAYQRLGRYDEAAALVAKALQLRPGSTAENVGLPKQNTSPAYLEAAEKVRRAFIAAGLPEK
jgi:DNA-binding winged helix-turn-helix (wHTH) protein/tetratricopeptide (TPR) repeat protein/TolB-like protein